MKHKAKMAFTKPLCILLLLIFISSIATAQPSEPLQDLHNAAETLSNSGYTSMSLIIQLLLSEPQSPLLLSNTTGFTIFSPPDNAFVASGQPSLSVILLHFSPLAFSQHALQSLSFSSTIPTLSPVSDLLYITTSHIDPSQISINGVNISGSPLFDDGSIIIFGIDDFLSPNFDLVTPNLEPTPNLGCHKLSDFSRYKEASGILKSRGYSIIASFLDLQLAGYLGSNSTSGMKFTMFAPLDEAMMRIYGDFIEYHRMFFIHLLPCKLSWTELNGIKNETVIGGFVDEYGIRITRFDNGEMWINGVRISAPEIYEDDLIVIHGLHDAMRGPPENPDEENHQLLKKAKRRNVGEAYPFTEFSRILRSLKTPFELLLISLILFSIHLSYSLYTALIDVQYGLRNLSWMFLSSFVS